MAYLSISSIGLALLDFPSYKKSCGEKEGAGTQVNMHANIWRYTYICIFIFACIFKLITSVAYGEWNQLSVKETFLNVLFLQVDYMTILPFEKTKRASKINTNKLCCFKYCIC